MPIDRLCCDYPPMVISGEGFGYCIICKECGRGIGGEGRADTFVGAEYLWVQLFETLEKREESVTSILLKEVTRSEEVLRNLAFVLGAGGYNSSEFDINVFEKKILAGIQMLADRQ